MAKNPEQKNDEFVTVYQSDESDTAPLLNADDEVQGQKGKKEKKKDQQNSKPQQPNQQSGLPSQSNNNSNKTANGKDPGFLDAISQSLDSALSDVGKAVDGAFTGIDGTTLVYKKPNTAQWFKKVLNIPASEVFLLESGCRAITMSGFIDGKCYITTNYWCFSWSANGKLSSVVIPLKVVDKVYTGAAMQKTGTNEITIFKKNDSPHNAIQLFTNDGKMHQFFAFSTDCTVVVEKLNKTIESAKSASSQYVPYTAPKEEEPKK